MTVNEKLLKALESATRYLEVSLSTLGNDEKAFTDNLWHAAAELEYALFLFSLILEEESDVSKWKPNPEIKKGEAKELLAAAHSFLVESKNSFGENLMNAYKCVYMARHYVFRVQEELARKKREASRK
ncbi:MAG: hypothetical protein ACPLKQ_04900 [Candidatus Bathyarchaeales archaeon]